MHEAGLDDVPVVVGGIIPPDDADSLKNAGVAAVYTPKDYRAEPHHGRRGSDRGDGGGLSRQSKLCAVTRSAVQRRRTRHR